MQIRAVIFLLLFLAGSAGRSYADENPPTITTPALKMTGMAVPAMRQPKITTPALKMTGMAVQSMRQSQITTPALKMTGMAVQVMRQPKITTPALRMTGMAVQTLRVPAVMTPALKMTGMAVSGLPEDDTPQRPEREDVHPMTDGIREDEIQDLGNKFTFTIPVELENMPDEADRFKVAVSVVYAGGGSRVLAGEAEKDIRNSRFDGTVSISVEPAPGFIGQALRYKASLVICRQGDCVSPLDSGADGWARPEPGSPLKASHEDSLHSERNIDVPVFLMTGNRADDRIQETLPSKSADFEGLPAESSDLGEVNAEMDSAKSSLSAEKTGRREVSL